MRAVLQRLALAALATAVAGARAADAPPTPSPVAPPEPMARVEQFVVRDVVQADGSVVRSEDVVVQVHTAMAVSAFGQVPVPYVDGYGEVTPGDLPGAAAVAREAAPRLYAHLDADDPTRFDDPARERFVLVVGEAWRLQGAAAFAAGDRAAAERYLAAAWQLAGTPDGAVDLARLRQAQGRHEEAIDALHQASYLPAWRANTAKVALERVVTDAGRRQEVLGTSRREKGKRHLFDVPGEAPPGGAQLRLKLLVDQRGRIVDVRAAQPADAAALDAWRARVLQTALPAFDVDGAAFKLVRAATLKCAADHGCRLGLSYYGDEVATVLER